MTTDNQDITESVITSSSSSICKTMVVFKQEMCRQEIVSRNRYDELMISSSEEEEEDEDDDDTDNDLSSLHGRYNARLLTVPDYSSSSSSSETSMPQLVVSRTRTRREIISLRRVRRRVNNSSDSDSDSDNNEYDSDNNDNHSRGGIVHQPRVMARVGQLPPLARRRVPILAAAAERLQRRFNPNESDASSTSSTSTSMGSMPGLQERAREDSSTEGDDYLDNDYERNNNMGIPLALDDFGNELAMAFNNNHNNNAANANANANNNDDRIGMIDQMFMDQLRIRDRPDIARNRNLRRAIWGNDDDDGSISEEGDSMPGLIQRNQNNNDSSSDEDGDDDSTIDGGGGFGLPQTPWVIRNRYRYNLENIPDPLWPILLERAQQSHRFINGIHDKPSGLYHLLRKGPLFLQGKYEQRLQINNSKSTNSNNNER